MEAARAVTVEKEEREVEKEERAVRNAVACSLTTKKKRTKS
jgi:hypothetical protein